MLLSLKEGLFDTISIEKIKEAENALLKNSKSMPNEIQKHIISNEKLGIEDQRIILKFAGEILTLFQDKPNADDHQIKK
jgi:F-type H+-transporting ATPase subunit alpha